MSTELGWTSETQPATESERSAACWFVRSRSLIRATSLTAFHKPAGAPRRHNPFQQRADDRARATAQQDLTLHECAGRFDPLCQLRHGARRVCVALPREPNCVDVQAAEDHAATGRLAPSA
jgi:hypothetical protein